MTHSKKSTRVAYTGRPCHATDCCKVAVLHVPQHHRGRTTLASQMRTNHWLSLSRYVNVCWQTLGYARYTRPVTTKSLFSEDLSSALHHTAAAHAETCLYFCVWVCVCVCVWPKPARNDMFCSNQALSRFPLLLSIDSSDKFQRHEMYID